MKSDPKILFSIARRYLFRKWDLCSSLGKPFCLLSIFLQHLHCHISLRHKSDTKTKLIKLQQSKYVHNWNAFHLDRTLLRCFLSASGNCDRKNVAVERENRIKSFSLLSFIKVCNQKPFLCRWFSGVQWYLVLHASDHSYFRNGGLSSLVVHHLKALAKHNGKFTNLRVERAELR